MISEKSAHPPFCSLFWSCLHFGRPKSSKALASQTNMRILIQLWNPDRPTKHSSALTRLKPLITSGYFAQIGLLHGIWKNNGWLAKNRRFLSVPATACLQHISASPLAGSFRLHFCTPRMTLRLSSSVIPSSSASNFGIYDLISVQLILADHSPLPNPERPREGVSWMLGLQDIADGVLGL